LEKLKEALNKGLSKGTILASLKKDLEVGPEVVSEKREDKTATLVFKRGSEWNFVQG